MEWFFFVVESKGRRRKRGLIDCLDDGRTTTTQNIEIGKKDTCFSPIQGTSEQQKWRYFFELKFSTRIDSLIF